MNDESELQITRKADESLVISSRRSTLIARGRRDAAVLSLPCGSESADSLSRLRQLAELGDPEAQSRLGSAYMFGHDVSKDYDESFKWHLKAANGGNSYSSEMAGYFYYEAQNYAEAVKWLPINTPTEFGIAEFYLGKCYFHGLGLQRDYAEAAQWLLEASLYGDNPEWADEIEYLIDYIYALGILSPRDAPVELNKWRYAADYYADDLTFYRKEADAGSKWSQLFLGLTYAYGRGVTQDDAEAARWFRKAADAGQVDAQFHLGLAYFYGRGVTQDYISAYAWSNRATFASSGEKLKLFSSVGDAIAVKMTAEQIDLAEGLTRNHY